MKIKFLSFSLVLVSALVLVSCGGKKISGNAESENIRQSAEKSTKKVSPTGDPVIDAKVCAEKMLSLVEDANSLADLNDADEQAKAMVTEFDEYYKGNSEDYSTFKHEFNRLYYVVYKDRVIDLKKKVTKLRSEGSK